MVYDITNEKSFGNLNKWKDGFLEHAAPTEPNGFPFVLLGNKIDREAERRTQETKAQQWCKSNGDMPYYETSAKENVHVDEAFIEMAKMAIKRESQNQVFLPESIGGAGGAIKLNPSDDKKRNKTKMEKKMCEC